MHRKDKEVSPSFLLMYSNHAFLAPLFSRAETSGRVSTPFVHMRNEGHLTNEAAINAIVDYRSILGSNIGYMCFWTATETTIIFIFSKMLIKIPTIVCALVLASLARADAPFCDKAATQVMDTAFAAWYGAETTPSSQPVSSVFSRYPTA